VALSALAGVLVSVIGFSVGVHAWGGRHAAEAHETVTTTCAASQMLVLIDGRWACTVPVPLTHDAVLTGAGAASMPLTTSGSVTLGSSLTEAHELGDGRSLGRHGCGRLGRPGVCP
jgi:hypothetical protein